MNDNISGFTIDNSSLTIDKNNVVKISGVTLASDYVLREEKKVNKFLEIKEGQEIDKIEEKYREEKKALIAADRINKILLETKEYINKIYEEERDAKRFSFSADYYIAKETREKIDELREKKDGKVAAIKEKYAEVAALVEDMPASDRIEIYERYEIL